MHKISVRLDRLTVSGKLKNWTLQDIARRFLTFKLRDGSFVLERYNHETDDVENMAYIAENQFQPESWRIDFNPANLNESEKKAVCHFIMTLEKAHFTRLDVAFDIFNEPMAMKHRVYRFNVTDTEIAQYRNRKKDIETLYWGRRKSEQQIRLYDKLAEQRSKKQEIPAEIKQWARLELQLRGTKPSDWIKCAREMLSQFKLDNLREIENPSTRSQLFGLINGICSWSEFSNDTCAKLRKMIKDSEGFNTSLADELADLLAANIHKLQQELGEYLAEFGVQEEA
ncbi:Replication initiation protein [Lactobacillus sp. XV13L]|nr:Replication initiation protein [Lactobacillus sp. XV13L]